MAEHDTDIAHIRAFNRFYTRIIGLLEEGMHASPYTLAEARLIHEIGKQITTPRSVDLARQLGMDKGRMSRLVWRLIDLGLVATTPASVPDRRSAGMALTRDGDQVFADLNAASDAAAARLLEPLDALRRYDLMTAMQTIERLLSPPRENETLVLRGHRIGELGWLVHRQGLLYHLEQGWNGEFEALIARIYAEFETAPETPPKSLWIAELAGQVAGSVFIVPSAEDATTAQLRMLYVEPMFRGHRIGRRLVAEAVRFVRASGYKCVKLWTQDCLAAARRIYQAEGFLLVREERHHAFGADLVGQYWQLDFD